MKLNIINNKNYFYSKNILMNQPSDEFILSVVENRSNLLEKIKKLTSRKKI